MGKTETSNIWYLSPVLYGSCVDLHPWLFILSFFIIFPNQLTLRIFSLSVKISFRFQNCHVRPFQLPLHPLVSKLCNYFCPTFLCIDPSLFSVGVIIIIVQVFIFLCNPANWSANTDFPGFSILCMTKIIFLLYYPLLKNFLQFTIA